MSDPNTTPAAPVPPPFPAAPPVGDPDELARLAAEAVALIEHHRAELQATMAELTALQRQVRTEIREAVAALQEVAAQLQATEDAGVAAGGY